MGLAALLLAMDSVADTRARRATFAAGMVLLLLATAVSAATPGTVFLAGRVLRGVAGAAVPAGRPPRRGPPRQGDRRAPTALRAGAAGPAPRAA
ncbi:hypothetical protein OG900_35995 [Streptomyces sp. NBC_00433]